MARFSEVENGLPPGSVVVPPEAWSSSWRDRPLEEVCLGLRFVPDAELEDARVEAFRRAESLFPKFRESEAEHELFVASFHETLIRWVISRGTCDPNDVRKHWDGWADAPEDIAVEQALTDHGAQFIFDEWEKMRIASDIALPIASDADVSLLVELARRLPRLAEISRTREQRCRRLLRFVLEELESVDAPPEPVSVTVAAASTRVDADEGDSFPPQVNTAIMSEVPEE